MLQTGSWRPPMPRLASLYFPYLAIERIQRSDARPSHSSPRFRGEGDREAVERSDAKRPVLSHEERKPDCSCPRGGGWRPGARWAGNSERPLHQQPTMRELGRRTDPAPVVFRTGPSPAVREREKPAAKQWEGEDRWTAGASDPPPRPLPHAGEGAMVTAQKIGNRVVLTAVSPAAEVLGLAPGMALTQARVLVPGLDVRDAEPERDAALLERLALIAARRWTPRAAV